MGSKINIRILKSEHTAQGFLNQSRLQGDFCDVILFTSDGECHAHMIVLSAHSTFFRKVFNRMSQKSCVGLYLDGFSLHDLEPLLSFIYKGEAELPENDLKRFLHTAEKLQIIGLKLDDYSNTKNDDEINSLAKDSAVTSPLPGPSKRRRSDSGSENSPQDYEHPDVIIKEESADIPEYGHQNYSIERDSMSEANVSAQSQNGEEGTLDPEFLSDDSEAEKYYRKIVQDQKTLFECTLCQRVVNNRGTVIKHLQRKHTRPTNEICPHCGKTYKNKLSLYTHIQSKRCFRTVVVHPKDPQILSLLQYNEEQDRWLCKRCFKTFRQKDYAREHVIVKHIGITSLTEPMPGENETDNPEVSKLMEFFPSQKNWKCITCGTVFKNSFYLRDHIERQHMNYTVPYEDDVSTEFDGDDPSSAFSYS